MGKFNCFVTKLSNGNTKIVSVFNYHPDTEKGAGLDYRTNIYYLETTNFGKTWQNDIGETVQIPLVDVQNNALVYDAEKEGKLVFINDVAFDEKGNTMISYITSKGPNPGYENGPYEFMTTFLKKGERQQKKVTNVDHNYDYGSLYYERGNWQIIAPLGIAYYSFNVSGELEKWELSKNDTKWKLVNRLTKGSQVNHSYPRKPVNYNPDFYAFWADGNPREQSISNLYFSNQKGEVFKLLNKFEGEMFKVKK